MSIVDLAREIGRELQKDKDYLSFKGLEKACDEDKELQDIIGEFNLKRMSLNDEASKADRDEDKIARLNNELRICYGKVMENENMAAYNKAKTSFENKVQQATAQAAEAVTNFLISVYYGLKISYGMRLQISKAKLLNPADKSAGICNRSV